MNIRVQRQDGRLETLLLSSAGWHIVTAEDRDFLVGAGMAHSFTKDGYYDSSDPAPVFLEERTTAHGPESGRTQRPTGDDGLRS